MKAKQPPCLSIDYKQYAVGAKKSAILTIEHAHKGKTGMTGSKLD